MLPLALFLALVGIGSWLVVSMAGSSAASARQQASALGDQLVQAVEAALPVAFTAAAGLEMLIQGSPQWPDLLPRFNSLAGSLMPQVRGAAALRAPADDGGQQHLICLLG